MFSCYYPVSVKQDLKERNSEVKDKPHVNHLDVGGVGQLAGYGDEHRGQDEHHCQVNRDGGFKEKIFEVVCSVSYYIQQDSWQEDSEESPKQPSTKSHSEVSCLLIVAYQDYGHLCSSYEVLGQLCRAKVVLTIIDKGDKIVQVLCEADGHGACLGVEGIPLQDVVTIPKIMVLHL